MVDGCVVEDEAAGQEAQVAAKDAVVVEEVDGRGDRELPLVEAAERVAEHVEEVEPAVAFHDEIALPHFVWMLHIT